MRLKENGLVLVPREEMESFVQRLTGKGYKKHVLLLHIPKDVANGKFKGGDLVEVALRKVSEEYAIQNYSGLPVTFHPVRYPFYHSAKCPKCGQVGLVAVVWKQKYVRIEHHRPDMSHFVAMLHSLESYPEIKKIVEKMRLYRQQILDKKVLG